jgi:hypothetical protein
VNGDNGVSVTSTPLGAGNENCPHGGSAFTSATGVTYACNGADGSPGSGSGGGLPVGSQVPTPQTDFLEDGAPHVLGSITVSSRSIVTFTASVALFPVEGSSGEAVRCGIESAGNGTGAGMPIDVGIAQSAKLPITVQGIAEAGTWNVTCRRLSVNGGYIVSPGILTAIQVGF